MSFYFFRYKVDDFCSLKVGISETHLVCKCMSAPQECVPCFTIFLNMHSAESLLSLLLPEFATGKTSLVMGEATGIVSADPQGTLSRVLEKPSEKTELQ